MKWLRSRKYRIVVSLAAGLAAAFLIGAAPETERLFLPAEKQCSQMYAWWGTLYPKFCFSKQKGDKVKISFWLAKAFDW